MQVEFEEEKWNKQVCDEREKYEERMNRLAQELQFGFPQTPSALQKYSNSS
jgi:hypothetical protein